MSDEDIQVTGAPYDVSLQFYCPPPKYIVWHDNHTEGWARSDELDTLEACFEYIHSMTYGHPFIITKPVNVRFEEQS